MSEWRKAWRLDKHGRLVAEEVEIMEVGKNNVLVKGDDHTSYRGNFFTTPEAAFDAAIEDDERSLRSTERRIANLKAARASVCS